MTGLFWLSSFFCLYSYFLYPPLLALIPVRRRLSEKADQKQLPYLSLIIAARNERQRIADKLRNVLASQYPADRFEIIVASDCSDDGTDDIVLSFQQQGVVLVETDERKGKEYAQWCAIQRARGEILVFSDVATRIEPDALQTLAEQFRDPRVGAVSSEDRFISRDGSVVGEGAYVQYEMWLRRLESQRAGLVGLSGSFFAARREVCENWDIYSPSDFNVALSCTRQGFVAISCPRVVGIYQDVTDPAQEYRRKVRTVIRGVTAVARHPEVLDPFRMGPFAFQVWSHKVLRWAVPWFMLLMLSSSLFLFEEHWIYRLALGVQVLFYALVLAGYLAAPLRSFVGIRIPYYLMQVNVAIAHATVLFLLGRRITVWQPSQR